MTTWALRDPSAEHDTPWAAHLPGGDLRGQHAPTPTETRRENADLERFREEEGHRRDVATNHAVTTPDEHQIAAHQVGQSYNFSGRQQYIDAAARMRLNDLGDMNDPEARLRALSFITQDLPSHQDPGRRDSSLATPSLEDPNARNWSGQDCGAASLVAGAFLANGTEGLATILRTLAAQDPTGAFEYRHAELEERLHNPAGLTAGDIQAFQLELYAEMTGHFGRQRTLEDLHDTGGPTGVSTGTMNRFLQDPQSAELSALFAQNGIGFDTVDADGVTDQQGRISYDHWVMRIAGRNGQPGAVYDPQARRGGQIVSDPAERQKYDLARVSSAVLSPPTPASVSQPTSPPGELLSHWCM